MKRTMRAVTLGNVCSKAQPFQHPECESNELNGGRYLFLSSYLGIFAEISDVSLLFGAMGRLTTFSLLILQ